MNSFHLWYGTILLLANEELSYRLIGLSLSHLARHRPRASFISLSPKCDRSTRTSTAASSFFAEFWCFSSSNLFLRSFTSQVSKGTFVLEFVHVSSIIPPNCLILSCCPVLPFLPTISTMCKNTDKAKQSFAHPLDPLSKDEITQVAKIVRQDFSKDDEKAALLRFETIELFEPPKATVRAFDDQQVTMDDVERKARVNVFYTGGGIGVYRMTVSLTKGAVLTKTFYPEARPMIQLDEFMEVEEVVRKDPRVVEALKKWGVTDMSKVCVDPWSSGTFGKDYEKGRHLIYTFMWVKASEFDNLYAHPVEGLNVVVDVKALEVVAIEEGEVVPIPQKDVNYEADLLKDTPARTDLKTINVTQPDGVSFRMEGNTLKWHDWSIFVGFNAREGITLHNMSYAGRPICYRASLAEMVVPYGSPNAPHYRKNVFDIGEYGK